MKKNNCALVIGSYVNGYSIIQELFEKGVKDIILFGQSRRLGSYSAGSYSNKIKKFVKIKSSSASLLKELENLVQEYEKIVIFPTDDLTLEFLLEIHEKISSYCFLPFNKENLYDCLQKFNQYRYCEILGIPYPKTIEIRIVEDILKTSSFQFPILIKPNKKPDPNYGVFKNLVLASSKDLDENYEKIKKHLSLGITFLASEIIPGNGSNIFAYIAYRSQEGKILNEWTGKKLSQFPDDFGVFASASNNAPIEILNQGRLLVEHMDLKGIVEPEFKYDHRDGKYKLMEINLRSMMWHRIGILSGVDIEYSQYLDATGESVIYKKQKKNIDIHFVYLKHEINNLFFRKNYLKIFFHNLFSSDKTVFAFYDLRDPLPFIIDCFDIIYLMIFEYRRRLNI